MYTCEKATELIEKEETEKLPLLTKMRLKMHLMVCATCSNYKKQSLFLSVWIKNKKASRVDTVRLSEDSKKEMIKKIKEKQLNL